MTKTVVVVLEGGEIGPKRKLIVQAQLVSIYKHNVHIEIFEKDQKLGQEGIDHVWLVSDLSKENNDDDEPMQELKTQYPVLFREVSKLRRKDNLELDIIHPDEALSGSIALRDGEGNHPKESGPKNIKAQMKLPKETHKDGTHGKDSTRNKRSRSRSGSPMPEGPRVKAIKSEPKPEAGFEKEFMKGGSKDVACKRPALYNHLNPHITSIFEELLAFQEVNTSDKDHTGKAIAYERALSVFRSWPERISLDNYRKLEKAYLLGAKTLDKVKDILETGSCKKLDAFRKNEKLKAALELTQLHGIGPKKAETLVNEGVKGLLELDPSHVKMHLDEVASFGLEKYKEGSLDFKWTKAEVDDFLKSVLDPFLEQISMDDMLQYEVVGGFRREKPFGGDLDILFTSSSKSGSSTENDTTKFSEYNKLCEESFESIKKPFDKAIQKLVTRFSKDDDDIEFKLLTGPSGVKVAHSENHRYSGQTQPATYMFYVLFKKKWKRLDLVLTPQPAWFAALLGWTGSLMFEKSLKLHASEMAVDRNKEYLLTHGGLFIVDKSHKKKLSVVNIKSEKDIFQKLGLSYLEPKERCH